MQELFIISKEDFETEDVVFISIDEYNENKTYKIKKDTENFLNNISSSQELKIFFKKFCLKWHPDKYLGTNKKFAKNIFIFGIKKKNKIKKKISKQENNCTLESEYDSEVSD